MDQRSVLFISIVCFLITLVVGSDPGSNAQESSLRAAASSERRNATWVKNVALDDGLAGASRGERERVERTDNEQVERQEDEEEEEEEAVEKDYQGGDEYEDELKAVAESHEAMSRDDTRNSNASTAPSTKLLDGASIDTKNFDSREVITVDSSDEDVASNEAITDELVDKYDQEVAELLKYKKERSSNHSEGSRTKTKRVPTVKKELSTQKEILIGSNETQVPKSLIPPEDTVNRLSDETEAVRRRNVETNGAINLEDPTYSERPRGEGEIVKENRNSELDAERAKKLDKRQETVLKDLKSYLLTEYATEEEQRRKLRELGAQEDLLTENLVKLLAKLAENPSRWERVQKLLLNAENELKSRNSLDASKRSYEPTSTLYPSASEPSNDSRKSRKKLKKKKKKPKHRFSTTTLTPVPATPPLLTTTETPWRTTPVQWRLVAERLFGPPWQQDLQGATEKTVNPRYALPQDPRSLPSVRELIEQNKSKSFPSDAKPILREEPGELGNPRLLRFGKIGARQPGHVQPRREFTDVYERPADLERMPDYDIPEAYHRLWYPQMPAASRDFVRRREEEYPGDFNVQSDGFPRNQEYEPQPRDFSLSKSWPDLSYKYNPPWRVEERPPPLPVVSENWPWRQPPADVQYWSPRSSFLPVEKSYWPVLENEEEAEREANAEKIWQHQRAQHSWNRAAGWPVEKPLKVPPSWQQGERPAKLYDRDQANGIWEKSKNRSELSRSSVKQNKEKVALPQITMKTWNSLTSDPATWPHKLPGAKPWPKDENGKSYNPNADLVRKLGLDKQNSGAWSKEETEKSSEQRKMKDEKQGRLFTSKDFAKEDEVSQTETAKHKSNDERSNFSDYKTRSGEPMKPWPMLAESKSSKDWMKTENMQGDDSTVWRRKYEEKNSWTNEATLPKIQSVGAWVMAADQSTWKPYHIKPMEPSDEATARRWKPLSRSNTDGKWAHKGSWTEKVNDSWMDQPATAFWPDKTDVPEPWPEKSNKPGSWFAKGKDPDAWPVKSSNSNSWKAKGDWSPKPEPWVPKMPDNNSWVARSGSWSTKSNESWPPKTNNDASKFNGDAWPAKAKEEDTGDAWPRKSNEQTGWSSKVNELSPWQQKISDEWSYGKSSSTGTWPTKWKQFAYHRVTAMPISKPGTTADAASSKAKNAFVAVSAVSSPKYTGNEWRKNEEDGRNDSSRGDELERSGNQLQVGLERPIFAWKKDLGPRVSPRSNNSDPLENQLEALRQIDFWSYKENEAEKRLASTSATTETTSSVPRNNSTPATAHRRGAQTAGNGNVQLETNRRTISMK